MTIVEKCSKQKKKKENKKSRERDRQECGVGRGDRKEVKFM